ncbi:acyltransferase [uncultured Nostoc sp.]|uniref:acyltransferase family protein n=1 Tax=uncultured Nostoc sp. TaxID=340711 RepID=UPI0026203411|nr:acyltransferase [uncultured Nostoc sp.]
MEKSSSASPITNPDVSAGANSHSRLYIPSLDGIRTIAFIIVFVFHAGLKNIAPAGFGVTVFFFLSGYLITTLLRQEYDHYQTFDFKLFYLRRILRIWPPFYLVLGLGAGLTVLGLLKGQIDLPPFLAQCLHYGNYYRVLVSENNVTVGSWVCWSLAVEEHFYLLFPLLYVTLRQRHVSSRRQMLIFWALCLAVLLWRCVLTYGFGASFDRAYYGTDTRLDSILFGCALAVNGNPILDAQHYSNKVWKYFFLPAGIILILFSFIYRSPDFKQTFGFTIQGIGLYPIFITAIRFPNWGLFAVLNLKWIRFLGVLSYSLYLVHDTVILAVEMYLPQLHKVLQGGISLLISFGLAYMIYQFLEFPLGQLRKKFSRA